MVQLVVSYAEHIRWHVDPAYAEVLATTAACNDDNACWAWTADGDCDVSGPSAAVSNST